MYSALPFAEFNPQVARPPPAAKGEEFRVATHLGFYDTTDTGHLSFYLADYLNGTDSTDRPLFHGSSFLFARIGQQLEQCWSPNAVFHVILFCLRFATSAQNVRTGTAGGAFSKGGRCRRYPVAISIGAGHVRPKPPGILNSPLST